MQNKHRICIHLHVPGDAGLRLCWNNTQTVNLVFADQDPNLYPGLCKNICCFLGVQRSTFSFYSIETDRYKAQWEESIFIFDYPSTDQRLCNTVTLQGLLIVKGCLSGHHRERDVKHPVCSMIRYQDEKRRQGSGGRQWELVCLNDLCKLGRDEILIISAEVRVCPGFRPKRHLKRKHAVHQAGWSVHIW